MLKPAEIRATEKLGNTLQGKKKNHTTNKKRTNPDQYTPGSFGRSQVMPTFSPAKIVLLGETLLTLLWKSLAQTKLICYSSVL